MRLSEIAFLRTVLVWLSTCIPYQLNIVSDYAITQYRMNASEIAHLVRIVCSGLKPRILDSQPNSIAFVRVVSVRPPLPTTRVYVYVYYDGMCGPCVAVVDHVLRMRGRPGRRGGSKACLGFGTSYH